MIAAAKKTVCNSWSGTCFNIILSSWLSAALLVRRARFVELYWLNRLSFGKVRSEADVWSFAPHDISMILSLSGQEPEFVEQNLLSFRPISQILRQFTWTLSRLLRRMFRFLGHHTKSKNWSWWEGCNGYLTILSRGVKSLVFIVTLWKLPEGCRVLIKPKLVF